MTARLPKEVEVRVGLFSPLFSEDYAKETWWDQLYHSNKGLDYLQSWQDSGLEIYRNFDFEEFSLPVYLYYLNGNTAYNGEYVDNNNAKTFMLHIAPEFFQTRLKLLGSVAAGKWDNDSNKDIVRYATGFEWKHKKLNFLTEYLYTKWEKRALTLGGVADAKREGYQCKLLYRLTPQWRALVNFSHAELYNSATATMRSDIYDTLTFALNYFITDSSSLIGQYSLVDGDRSDQSDALNYNRFTLGWRTTF